jgi:5-methylcytosine-specific restriction endonuclease McrBC GTP-binding regulatory subunit McrB
LESNTFWIGYQFYNSSIYIGFSLNKIKNDYQLFDTGLTKLAKISKNQILSVISYNIIF